jgi:membrane protein DedA with SNARE-associated domain/predicted transcriptional regulator
MSFLQGIHGAVALGLLGGLLFAEEAGVPLPFAPGELTLLVAGLLIASGGLNPALFIPLALVACIAGSLVGYTWARVVGERALQALARRLRQQRNLERVTARMRSAGWFGIGLTRLIPGFRIYTTLVAGAVQVPRRTFLIAMVTSTVLWVGGFTALGVLVGVPVEHLLSQVQQLAFQGIILIAMGVGCYIAIRRTPASSGAGLVRLPRWARVLLAAVLDIGVVASVITGLLALGRLLGLGFGAGWIDPVVALFFVGAFYVVVARRSGGATVGELLLQTSYISGQRMPLRPRAALQAVRALLAGSHDAFSATADLLRALGDPERLRIVTLLLDRPRRLDELASQSGQSAFEVRHQLDRLREMGVLVVTGDELDPVYGVQADVRPALVQLLAAMQPAVTAPAPHEPNLAPPVETT